MAKSGSKSTHNARAAGHEIDRKGQGGSFVQLRPSVLIRAVPPTVCDNVRLGEASGGVAHRCQCLVYNSVEREGDTLD